MHVQLFQHARMQFAEIAQNVLRPELQRAAAARMEPAGRAAHKLQAAHRHAKRGQQRHDVRLGVEGVHRGRAARPVTARARGLGPATAHGGGAHALVLRAVAFEDLTDLEQGRVAQTLVRIALHGGDEARQQRGAHVRQVRRDGVGQRQRRRAAAKQGGARLGHEGPGHRFHQSARRQGPSGEAGALLQQGQDRLADGLFLAQQGRRDHLVEARDAQNLLHQIGLALHIRAPAGDLHIDPVCVAGLRHDAEAEVFENRRHFGDGEVEPREALDLAPGEFDGGLGRRRGARHHQLGRLAAADFHHQPRRQPRAGNGEGRINAPFEAIARVGDDAEAPAGAGDVEGVPQGALDQHVGRVLVAAGQFAAHDARDGFDALVVADHHMALIELVDLAIESQQLLARLRAAHDEIARDLLRVEDMERAGAVEGEVIGDVDQRIDGPQADFLQALLHPVGRGAVLDAAHKAHGEEGRQMSVGGGEIEGHAHRTGEGARHGLDLAVLQAAKASGGEIARHPMNARRIRAVGGEVDFDQRLVEARIGHIGLPHRRVGGQFDDALMVVGEFQLEGRAEHAIGFDAANDALAQGDSLGGNIGPWGREDAFQPRARIGRPADHLNGRIAARIHEADAQPVRIGMGLGFDHMGDDEILQLLSRIRHMLDLKANARERLDDLSRRRVGVEVVLEPGEGEFHVEPATFSSPFRGLCKSGRRCACRSV